VFSEIRYGKLHSGSTVRDTTPLIKATVRDNRANLQKANKKLYVAGKLISRTRYAYNASTDLLTHNSPRPRSFSFRETGPPRMAVGENGVSRTAWSLERLPAAV